MITDYLPHRPVELPVDEIIDIWTDPDTVVFRSGSSTCYMPYIHFVWTAARDVFYRKWVQK